jgi:hypothetical protein
MKPVNQISQVVQSQNAIQPALDAKFLEDYASQSQTADKKVAPAKLSPLHPQPKAR